MDNIDVWETLIGVVAVTITIVAVTLLCVKKKHNFANANSSRHHTEESQEGRYVTMEQMEVQNVHAEIGWVPSRLVSEDVEPYTNVIEEMRETQLPHVEPYTKVIEEMKKRETQLPHKQRLYYENWETNITRNKKKRKQTVVKSTKPTDSRKRAIDSSKAVEDNVYDSPIMIRQAESDASITDVGVANDVYGIEMTSSDNEFNPEDIEFEENELYEGGI